MCERGGSGVCECGGNGACEWGESGEGMECVREWSVCGECESGEVV